MARPKTNNTGVTINFENIVIDKIKSYVKKHGGSVSSFVNGIMKGVVMNDLEYYRAKARECNAEFQKWRYLLEEEERLAGLRE